MTTETTLRIARPTEHLAQVLRFYIEGLGWSILDAFQDHEGIDGVMVGLPGAPYHLELTFKPGDPAGPAPTPDDLLVFYLSGKAEWQASVDRLLAAGYKPVSASNPYWDRVGLTFEDPDGYRVVLENTKWFS